MRLLQTNSFKNMLNKKKIIAIFNKNYFIEELITLLEDEGLEIEKIKNIQKAKGVTLIKFYYLILIQKNTRKFKGIFAKKLETAMFL